jgi:hypothetical protein
VTRGPGGAAADRAPAAEPGDRDPKLRRQRLGHHRHRQQAGALDRRNDKSQFHSTPSS